MHNTFSIIHYTLSAKHNTFSKIHYTLLITHNTFSNIHYTLSIIHYTFSTMHNTLSMMHNALSTIHYTFHHIWFSIIYLQYTYYTLTIHFSKVWCFKKKLCVSGFFENSHTFIPVGKCESTPNEFHLRVKSNGNQVRKVFFWVFFRVFFRAASEDGVLSIGGF